MCTAWIERLEVGKRVRTDTPDYLRRVVDGRVVILSGRAVTDVAKDPATTAMAHLLAEVLADGASDPDFLDLSYAMATSPAEVAARGRAFEWMARRSGGLLGRSPDFLATIVTAWAAAGSHFGCFEGNIRDYWAESRCRRRVLTHAISDPPGHRDRDAAAPAADLCRTLRVVGRSDDGLVVRGAKMLATLAPFADELVVYPYRPLGADEDDLALCFAVPVATPGLTLYCRPSLAEGAGRDNILASRFDEMDALCVFDDVVIPWHRVFIDGDVAAANGLRAGTQMTAYAWHQSGVRAWVKAEFLYELAAECARTADRANTATVRQQLGELAGIAEVLRSLVVCAEAGARPGDTGAYICDQVPLACSAMVNAQLNPRAVELLELIVSSGLILHPTLADEDPAAPAHELFRNYFAGHGGTDAWRHAALLRAAAEMTLDRFGRRQVLYERVFVGQPDAFRAKFFDQFAQSRLSPSILPAVLG